RVLATPLLAVAVISLDRVPLVRDHLADLVQRDLRRVVVQVDRAGHDLVDPYTRRLPESVVDRANAILARHPFDVQVRSLHRGAPTSRGDESSGRHGPVDARAGDVRRGGRLSRITAAATSAPPPSVCADSGWARTRLARNAPQNGSTVLMIAVRTGPIAASPRRNSRKATTVHTTANRTIASQAIVACLIARPPVAIAAMPRITAAPTHTNVAVTAA